MKKIWEEYIGKTLNITMNENYGVVYGNETVSQPQFFEIVFKTGKLIKAFDEGLILEASREEERIEIFIPYSSIKCVDIFSLEQE